MIVRELGASEEERWDRFVAASEAQDVHLRAGWKRVLEQTYGHETRYLVAEEGTELCGILPLMVVTSRLFGSYVTSLPGGMRTSRPGAEEPLLEAAIDIAEAADAGYLVLRDGRRPFSDGLITSEHHCTLVLELPDEPRELWEGFRPTVRNRVRRAEKAGLSVEIGGEEKVEPFYRVFSHNMRDLGTPVFDRQLVENVVAEFRDETRILIVQEAGRPIGGMVLLSANGVTYNPWISSLRAFFDHCPNDLLVWQALRWACRRGSRQFDFGRSQWNSGTFRFKVKWGAEAQPLYYQYYLRRRDRIPDPALQATENQGYRAAAWIWRRLPVPLTRVIGPRIVTYLNPLG